MESENRGSTSDDSERGYTSDDSDVHSESSSSKDSPLSLTLLNPDVLDCPICCEPLKIPIFQCNSGHLVCSACCTKVRNKCPSCTLPICNFRCIAMEKVIEALRVSCPNAKYGCIENMLYGNRSSHAKLCIFAPCSCPVGNCNYTGYYKDLNDHVRAKHKDDVTSFVLGTSLNIRLDLNEETRILQEANDGEVFVVQVFEDLHVAYVTVRCIAPLAPEVGKISCSFEKLTVDSSLRQGFMLKNIQKVRNVQPKVDFMVIPYHMAGSFVISIGRDRAFVHV